mgnify:CR=1 FL=1
MTATTATEAVKSFEDELGALLAGSDIDLSDLEELNEAPSEAAPSEEQDISLVSAEVIESDDDIESLLAALDVATPEIESAKKPTKKAAKKVSVDEVMKATKVASDAKAVKPKSAESAAPKKPRANTAGMQPSEAFAHKYGTELEQYRLTLTDTDLEACKSKLEAACDSLAKKTKEKAINMQAFRVNGDSLSVYTDIAMRLLISKGEMTTAELKNAYMTATPKAYTPGTANAQSGQIFQLLPAFDIATKADSKTLVLNEENVAVIKFKETFMS